MNEMELINILDYIASGLIVVGLLLAVVAAIGATREWYLFNQQQKNEKHGNH